MTALTKKRILLFVLFLIPFLNFSCRQKNTTPSNELLSELQLKRGELISCGASGEKFGSVDFLISCNGKVKKEFNLAVELLHSFEYDEAEKVFAKIIDEKPDCAMAYWGAAMCNYHPLWTPPTEAELKKGSKLITIAKQISEKSKREADYIDALYAFYNNWEKLDHRTRAVKFEQGMEKLYSDYPKDKEAAIFYALALDASADPADKSFKNQKQAGSILNTLSPLEPDHPGIVHYIIHTYDYPELASMALPAARKYASVAPSSAHALHMSSHIFTRMGLWDECINSNLASISSAQCYAQTAGIKGHWDEELHGLDYLMYGYLQKGDNQLAKKQWDYLESIDHVSPVNFKVAYAYAAIPCRYLLENKEWNQAAKAPIDNRIITWKNYPWQEAIIHFTRLLGFVHLNQLDSAEKELQNLQLLNNFLLEQKDSYKANQVAIQMKTSQAWIAFKKGSNNEAVTLMRAAADMEDKTEKHPVTPGEVLPAKELLGDMFMEMNKSAEALVAYEDDLKKHPNRFNAVYGAGLAAEKSGNYQKAQDYYRQLLSFTNSQRPEVEHARFFLKRSI